MTFRFNYDQWMMFNSFKYLGISNSFDESEDSQFRE